MSEKPDIEQYWSCLPEDSGDVELVVTIPTFKRPDHLRLTLESVLEQDTERRFAIVIMDNHPQGSEGAIAAADMLRDHSVPSVVILAHRRGNCAAYNAGFQTALDTFPNAGWILVIDDDEIASPHWIEKMLEQADRHDPDFVGAPQPPVFENL